METKPGRKIFDEHMAYLGKNDIDGMIDGQYHEDAVFVTNIDFKDTPPVHTIKGNKALKKFYREYIDWHGFVNVESMDYFSETEEFIFFQSTFTSQTGKWTVGDVWYVPDSKIAYHSSFAFKR